MADDLAGTAPEMNRKCFLKLTGPGFFLRQQQILTSKLTSTQTRPVRFNGALGLAVWRNSMTQNKACFSVRFG